MESKVGGGHRINKASMYQKTVKVLRLLNKKIFILTLLIFLLTSLTSIPAFASTGYRYLLIEVDGILNSNGNAIVVNEVQAFDSSNKEYLHGLIPISVYDSVRDGIPYWWNGDNRNPPIWDKTKLTNGTWSYINNVNGQSTSTLFCFLASAHNTCWARFTFDMGNPIDIDKIRLYIGGTDRRNPQVVKIYGTNSYLASQVSSARDDTNLTFIGAINPPDSTTVSNYDLIVTYPVPSVPINLEFSGIGGDGTLVWRENPTSDNVTSYNIYDDGNYIASTTTNSYSFSGLSPGCHSFQITAINSNGESAKSTAYTYNVPPDAPIVTINNITTKSATAIWTATSGATYDISVNDVFLVNTANTSYNLNSLSPASTYQVSIVTKTSYGNSTPGTATFTTLLPSAPTGLTVGSITPTGANASWNQVYGANSYNLYLDGSPIYNTLLTQYGITGLAPGSNHIFEVRTVISEVESSPGASTVSFSTLPMPEVPKDLTATATAYNQVQLSWQANTEPDLTGYIIYRDYNEIARVGKDATGYTDDGLQPNTKYIYGIEAYNTSNVASGMSNAATVTTQKIPIPIITARVDNRNINISWTGSADNFLVMVNGQQVGSTTANQYSYTGQPGAYKIYVVAVVGSTQQASSPVNVQISSIETPGASVMTGDVLKNAGIVLYPAGGLLALALALKASPLVVAAIKAGLFRRLF